MIENQNPRGWEWVGGGENQINQYEGRKGGLSSSFVKIMAGGQLCNPLIWTRYRYFRADVKRSPKINNADIVMSNFSSSMGLSSCTFEVSN